MLSNNFVSLFVYFPNSRKEDFLLIFATIMLWLSEAFADETGAVEIFSHT